jgi:hypothetical protein
MTHPIGREDERVLLGPEEQGCAEELSEWLYILRHTNDIGDREIEEWQGVTARRTSR